MFTGHRISRNAAFTTKFRRTSRFNRHGKRNFIAAENTQIKVKTAIVEIDWLGEVFSLPVFVSEHDEAIIGVEMFADCVVTIDFINSEVAIDKSA